MHQKLRCVMGIPATAILICAALTGCKSDGKSNDNSNGFTIGGSVSGLASGQSVNLVNNGADKLSVAADGAFVFATPVSSGGSFNVKVAQQPTDQACSVAFQTATGSNVSGNVTNIAVTCKNLGWTQATAPNKPWSSIAASADGTHLATVYCNLTFGDGPCAGQILLSSDGGNNWKDAGAPLEGWDHIVSSADGTHLAVATFGNGVYTSSDGGTSWTHTSIGSGGGYWGCIQSSTDGMRLIVTGTMTHVSPAVTYSSSDGGVSWALLNLPNNASGGCTASSGNGLRLATTDTDLGIQSSADGGITWTRTGAPQAYWKSLAWSADGTHLAASNNKGGIFKTTDGGVTWTDVSPGASSSGFFLAYSADGTHLAAAGAYAPDGTANGGIYTSADNGVSWTKAPLPIGFWSLASSADGTHIAAVDKVSGTIWVGIVH